MSMRELETRQDGQGLEVCRDGQGGAGAGNGVTGAASVCLLGTFLDHRRPQALLLRGGGEGVSRGLSHTYAAFE
eukprot:scaffold22842_cov65-Phaeocystis_antarctica.AAC.11